MSFEILSSNIKIPSLTIVSFKRKQAAEELKFLHNKVRQDPNASRYELNELADCNTFVVPFWSDANKRLRASTEQTISDNKMHYELAVLEQAGNMSYRVAEQDIMTVDIASDPFAQLILNYFREQYGKK